MKTRTLFVVTCRNGGLMFGRNGVTRISEQMARFLTRAEAQAAMSRYNECWSESSGVTFTNIEEINV